MSSAAGPTRRAVLAATSLVLLSSGGVAACTARTDPASSRRPARPPAPTDPDVALRSAAAERERALLREYDAVLAARPGLSPRLRPLRGHHAEHLEALLGPAPSTSEDPSAIAPAPPPADDAAALVRLTGLERAAGDAHARDCLAASRVLAPVLASLSAGELSHQVALS